jgi:pantoate--beta-alanine ligase
MGALHEGHLSLIQRARAECRSVVATIFVNPTQFGTSEDFRAYPRDEATDLALLRDAGTDLVFVPSVEEVYAPGFSTAIDVGAIAEPLEGAARPGHFQGVATVVTILLDLVGAQRAYFGQKDAQQTLVVKRLVEDLALPVEVVVCPTVREPDGLALSSRNRYLSTEERAAAPALYRALREGQARVEAGERDASTIRAAMEELLVAEPLVGPEYVSVADGRTLRELERIDPGDVLLSLAARVGSTRLIDNIPLRVA